jgi:hypothetical protein
LRRCSSCGVVSCVTTLQKQGKPWSCTWCKAPNRGHTNRNDPAIATIADLAADMARHELEFTRRRPLTSSNARGLLPPEEATSWEEFQARLREARSRDRDGNDARMFRLSVAVIALFVAAYFSWFGVMSSRGIERWAFAPVAAVTTGLLVWAYLKAVRARLAEVGRWLDRYELRMEWKARFKRGEIPRSSPGDPKIFRDQLEEHDGEA